MRLKVWIFSFIIFQSFTVLSQQSASIKGWVKGSGEPLGGATVHLKEKGRTVLTDSSGYFHLDSLRAGKYTLQASMSGYGTQQLKVQLEEERSSEVSFEMEARMGSLDEVVVTGTLKEVKRTESPVPVEVYTPQFFKKNPTPNIFEALQNINGVRPQLNCNVCNTGDIHINGLEGPYTMVLIDGMPIVSSLSTVYGLSGIPNSLVERIEIVKGPASSLYGSEAVGGLINIITKKPAAAPRFSGDAFSSSWGEVNADLGLKLDAGKRATVLTGLNYFNYSKVIDKNDDGFTDIPLQHRISLFQKWNVDRANGKVLSAAARFFYEDRWGGETHWTKHYRGGNERYGESIYTKRWEVIGTYGLPVKEKMMLSISYNHHDQDSRYGIVSYKAQQHVAFSQLTWDKALAAHDLLAGLALRYTFYDDNTPATAAAPLSKRASAPQQTWLPGIFVQDEVRLSAQHKLLLGLRYDYNSAHGNIFTPRFAYKWSVNDRNILRFNAGTGFRVVNLFTEDHAALTGARTVVVEGALRPERSFNVNLNYLKKIYTPGGNFITLDVTGWYTSFNNRIVPDYLTDPNKIYYRNLNGYAVSKGVTANVDLALLNGFKALAGFTLQDVSTIENGVRTEQLLTERVAATWSLSYKFKAAHLSVDYTGNLYGPMGLPLLGPLDPRLPRSPAWSTQNLQLTWSLGGLEFYGGLKNILNYTPNKGNPFIIARSHDPFDKQVVYEPGGQVAQTAENPYALTFDPTYVFAPNQGRRGFVGVRLTVR